MSSKWIWSVSDTAVAINSLSPNLPHLIRIICKSVQSHTFSLCLTKLPSHLSVSHIWPSLEISSPCLKAVPPCQLGCVELRREVLAPFGCLLRQSPLPKGRRGLFLHTSDDGDLTTSKRKEKLCAANSFASALFFTRISSVAPSKRVWSGIAFTKKDKTFLFIFPYP